MIGGGVKQIIKFISRHESDFFIDKICSNPSFKYH